MAMSGASTDYIGFRYALDEIINEETYTFSGSYS